MANHLVTGAAGFIGFHLARRLLRDGHRVVGLDNVNDYYDVRLKRDRLALLAAEPAFSFAEVDVVDREGMRRTFGGERFDVVYHLAAQAGVRHSLDHPHDYVDSNVSGMLEILEGCRHSGAGHLVYASSSSVYGSNTRQPFCESDGCDHPLSLYAATKRCGELMAHSYSHLYGLPTTGARFFTVYGPWGRPDMALFKFTESILAGRPVTVYGHGQMQRDFTYVDDVVEVLVRIGQRPPESDPGWSTDPPDPATSSAPFRIYNVGGGRPVELMHFLAQLQSCLGQAAEFELLGDQPGDVRATEADATALQRDFGFVPQTTVEEGIRRFVRWYLEYYRGEGR